jgi:hypothetical protein
MARIHFIFMQEEWKRDVPRVPCVGETVTFEIVDTQPAQDYKVGAVHWFDSYGATLEPIGDYLAPVFPEMTAWVSLYIPPTWPVVRDHPPYPGRTDSS